MLARREFLKLSVMMAAGAVIPLSLVKDAVAVEQAPLAINDAPPIFHLHGHKKSGCAFHPEKVDLWAGGGAQLPDFL